MNEREFMRRVRVEAEVYGWLCYAVLDTREHAKRTLKGFPDLVLIRPPRVIFAELKTDRGKLTPAQEFVGEQLSGCSEMAYRVWRPRDSEAILCELVRGGG